MAGCGDVLSLEDLQTAKKHQIFEAEVITGKAGGVAGGADIGYATNPVTGQTQQTLPGVIADVNADFDAQILNMGFTRVGTFAAGATLTNPRQTLLWDVANGGDGQEYGWSGAFPKVVPAASTPASTGGISVGAWMSRFDPELRIQVRESLRRSYAEAGRNLVDGSFEAGGTVTTATDVLLFAADGKAYSYTGTLPHTVSAGSTPSSEPDAWVDQSNKLLLEQLGSQTGAYLSGYGATTVGDKLGEFDATSSGYAYISQFGLSDTDASFNATRLDTVLRNLQGSVSTIFVDKSYSFDTGYDYVTGDSARRVSRIPEFKWIPAGGELTGLYNLPIQHETMGEYTPCNGSSIAIKKGLSSDVVTVCIMGDSISAEWADSLAVGLNEWEIIKAEFRKQNPGTEFYFVNRAIGGQTWLNANTKPTAFPSWYTDTNLDWVYYVVDPKPDIVIFAFGMNDNVSFNMGTMVSTINKVKAALPNAHLCMIPCMTPSRSSDYNNGFGFDGLRYQEGRNFAAGAERTYAEFYGMSVFDLNRAIVAWRDGKDLLAEPLTEVQATLVNGAYRADPCVDFSFECKISGWDKTTPIYLNIGGDDEDQMFIGGSNGKFSVVGRTEYINSYYATGETAVAIPSGDFWLTTSVVNNCATVYLSTGPAPITDASGNTLIATFRVIRHGGIIRPAIGFGGFATGLISDIRVMTSTRCHVKKTLTDSDIWGVGDALPSRKSPHGGNGINHPSTVGMQRLIAPVMAAQDLRIKSEPLSVDLVLGATSSLWASAPKAVIQDSVVVLSGGIASTSVAGSGDAIAKIPEYTATSDKLVSTLGCGSGGAWGGVVLRVKVNGDIQLAIGSITFACALDGISISTK